MKIKVPMEMINRELSAMGVYDSRTVDLIVETDHITAISPLITEGDVSNKECQIYMTGGESFIVNVDVSHFSDIFGI